MKHVLRVIAVTMAVSIGLFALILSACGSTSTTAQMGLALGLTACALGAWAAYDGIRSALARPTAAQCNPDFRLRQCIGVVLLIAPGLPLGVWAVMATVAAHQVSTKDPSWQLTFPSALASIALLGWAISLLRRALARHPQQRDPS